MYIVAIGWLYVAMMMAITETNVVAGAATFLLYGLAPVSIVIYIMGTPGRRRRRKAQEAREAAATASPGAADLGNSGHSSHNGDSGNA